jgi:hypothetical protein
MSNVCSHCPWVDNCVAVNNHRHFLIYIVTMAIGIISFLFLVSHCKHARRFTTTLLT